MKRRDDAVDWLEQSGYLIEYIKEPLTLEDELINYCHQWVDQKIEVFER